MSLELRRSARLTLFLLLIPCLLFFSTFLEAQTRIGEIQRQQAEKAKSLHVYIPTKGEKWIARIEGWGLIGPPKGFYPFIGSAYAGGGFTGGLGYHRMYADTGIFDIHGGYSIRSYKLIDASLKLPEMAQGRAITRIHGSYIDATQVAFFGIGNDTSKNREANFAYNPKSIEVTETLWPARWFNVGGGVEYVDYQIDQGESTRVPSIEEIFNPARIPGFGTDPTYIVGSVFAAIDWRNFPGFDYTTRGGYYGVEYSEYKDRDDLGLSFHRIDLEGRQYIPILRANQVIALRALASLTDAKSGEVVPFFLLPKLGGGNELRGFRDFRFRDTHRMLLTAEYRWLPSKFMDVAIFYETGKVASKREDLDFSDLHKCYGVGLRFHSPAATAFRIEFAHSVEGNRIILSGGAFF